MFKQGRRSIVLAATAGLLVGGMLTTVTPAGASLATNWKQIWKQEIKPRADKRYYTKAQSAATYETKAAHDASLGNYYTKGQSDATYESKAAHDASVGAALGNYYTKSQGDARYAPSPTVIRGVFMDLNGPAAGEVDSPIQFGVVLAQPPTVHYIKVGDPVPAGCGGNAQLPDAAPGHLCAFETGSSNVTTRGIAGANAGVGDSSDTFGAYVYAHSANDTGLFWIRGTWALRPGALAPVSATVAPAAKVNTPSGNPGLTR